MICNIVACGPSGKYWDGKGYSIGVNDCRKWGHEVDILLIVNSLDKYPERKKIVQDSRPREKLLGLGMWNGHPKYEPVPYMNKWRGTLEHGKIYKSSSSPFIAATIAYNLGYDKIVLWGVDMNDHPIIKGPRLASEIGVFASLQNELLKKGCSMYLGQVEGFENTGALAGLIPGFTWIHSID